MRIKFKKLSKQRRERILRQDFLDRLRFQIDSYYRKGNFKNFLIVRLKKMTLIEVQNGPSPLWKFLKYLTVALEGLSEPDDPIEFIEGYLKKSNIIDPIAPHIYGRTRNYSNGVDNEAAHSVDLQDVGELVEKNLRVFQDQKAQEEAKSGFNKVGGEALPSVDGEALPSVDGEALPSVDGEALPSVDGEALPSVDGEALPSVGGEALPSVGGEALPSVGGEALPSVGGEALPSVGGEALPSVGGEALPSVGGEALPSVDQGTHFIEEEHEIDIDDDDDLKFKLLKKKAL